MLALVVRLVQSFDVMVVVYVMWQPLVNPRSRSPSPDRRSDRCVACSRSHDIMMMMTIMTMMNISTVGTQVPRVPPRRTVSRQNIAIGTVGVPASVPSVAAAWCAWQMLLAHRRAALEGLPFPERLHPSEEAQRERRLRLEHIRAQEEVKGCTFMVRGLVMNGVVGYAPTSLISPAVIAVAVYPHSTHAAICESAAAPQRSV
jgi:hypothetical protein